MRVAVVALFLVAACAPAVQPSASPTPTGSPAPSGQVATSSPVADVAGIAELRSSVGREPLDTATPAQLNEVVAADTDFAVRLYHQLVASEQGDVFISPYSISTALSMTYAGAR